MTKSKWSRMAAYVVAMSAGATALAGCGGGGGGGGGSSSGGYLLNDDFNSFSTSRWGVYNYLDNPPLQRAAFGFTPEIKTDSGTSYVQLRLDTYNPDNGGSFAGSFLKGTEFYSKSVFSKGNGLQMTTRMRIDPASAPSNAPGATSTDVQPGIIFAFFSFNQHQALRNGSNIPVNDEIDFEFLTSGARNKPYTNIFNDWAFDYNNDGRVDFPPAGNEGYDPYVAPNPSDDPPDNERVRTNDDRVYQTSVSNPNFDFSAWNIYTVQWLPALNGQPAKTVYLINGNVERTETEVVPDNDLAIHFNIWAAASAFQEAYSALLQPTSDPAQNKSYLVDVDYVRVSNITSGATARAAVASENIRRGGR